VVLGAEVFNKSCGACRRRRPRCVDTEGGARTRAKACIRRAAWSMVPTTAAALTPGAACVWVLPAAVAAHAPMRDSLIRSLLSNAKHACALCSCLPRWRQQRRRPNQDAAQGGDQAIPHGGSD
jgi:hypothetical protein